MEKKKSAIDLTTGEPLKLLVLFALPMLIGSIFQLMYNMVDSSVLGRYVSKDALAAVGATGSTFSLVMMVGNAVTNGMSILVSHAWGSKNENEIHRIIGHSFMLALATSVIVALLSLLARPLMQLLGTPENIIDDSVTYLTIICGLYVGHMFYNASSSILRAIGDSKTPLYFLILCSLLNIALDLFFVIVFKAGVAGVAWATVISQTVSAVLCIGYMLKKYSVLRFTPADMKPDAKLLKKYAGISIPMVLQSSMLSIGMMAITYVINSFGSDIVAAYTVGGKVEQLVTVVFSQVAFSFSIYSGQNFGAKKYDRINLGMQRAMILLSGLVAVSMLIMFFLGDKLALLFVMPEETATLEAALKMIRVDGAFLPMLCAIWLFNSCLRGMGHVIPTVFSSIIELCSKIGFSFLLSHFFGYIGIWFAAPLGWVIGLIPSMCFFYFGHWKEKALKKDEEALAKA